MSSSDFKRQLITIFFIQKQIIVSVALLIFASGLAIAFFSQPVYTASGEILIKAKKVDRAPDVLSEQRLQYRDIEQQDLYSEIQIITSIAVLDAAVKAMKANNTFPAATKTGLISSFKGLLRDLLESIIGKVDEAPASDGDVQVDPDALRLQKGLTTRLLPASNVIQLTFDHQSPQHAKTILAGVMNAYIATRMDVFSPEESVDFFSGQLARFEEKLDRNEEKLISHFGQTGAVEPEAEIQSNLEQKKLLEVRLQELHQIAVAHENMLGQLDTALVDDEPKFFSFLKGELDLSGLSTAIQQLIVEEATLNRKFTDQHPDVRAIKLQLRQLNEAIRAEVSDYKLSVVAKRDTTLAQIAQIEERIKEINKKNVTLKKQQISISRVSRDLDLYRHSYETFAKRLEEARVDTTGGASNFFISILAQASVSKDPTFPNKKTLIPISLIAGIMTGCALGFLIESLDRTFKTPEDLARYADLPPLFSIADYETVEDLPEWQQRLYQRLPFLRYLR